jgi:hypothetical protein
MYHLERSIRRHAVGSAGLLCLILVVVSASRCTSDSITGGENPGPEGPGPADPDPVDTPLEVGSVTLSPDSLTVGVEETAQLSVIVRDRNGTVIADPQVVFTMIGLDGTVDSNGLVTAGLLPGVGRVKAWSRGVNSNAAVITVVSEVGSVTLSPDSLTIRQIGGTAQLGVIVRDTTGAVIANPQVSFFGALEGVGTVDSTGLVTGLRCGVGTIMARSRGVNSNVARVTVLPSSADCSSGSPWGSSRIAFQLDGDIQLVTFPGGEVVNLTNHPAEDTWPALSPDRSQIVFSSDRDSPTGEFELYSMNVDGSGLVRLTNSPGWDLVGPQAWSPDGARIVFTSWRDDPSGDIYIMNADGSGVVRLTENSHSDGCAAWSPDGSSIAFCSGDIPTGIYRMGTTPGSPIVRIASEGFSPDWSPDGSRIAYMTGVCWDTGCDIAVIGVNGTGFVQLHQEGTYENALQPSWSPDGSWIAFTIEGRRRNSEVAIVRFGGNGFGEIFHLTDGYAPSWR